MSDLNVFHVLGYCTLKINIIYFVGIQFFVLIDGDDINVYKLLPIRFLFILFFIDHALIYLFIL